MAAVFAVPIIASASPGDTYPAPGGAITLTELAGGELTASAYTLGITTDIVIPASCDIGAGGVVMPVVPINTEAFLTSDVTSVSIPGTVKTIGNRAFRSCVSLTAVSLQKPTHQ